MTISKRWEPTGHDAPSRRSPGRRLHGSVLNKLGLEIVTGRYPPGTVFGSETAFSQELEISRGAYREATQLLAAKGLIESRPKAGTRVLPRSRWNVLDPDVLAWAFAGAPDLVIVGDIFELRATIEPAAAALAARRRSKDDLAGMKRALAGMREHSLGSEAGRAADRDFHDALLRATHNGAMANLSASICAAVGWTTRFKHQSAKLPRNPIPDHVAVYEAIAVSDPDEAARRMQILIELAHEDTKAALST